MSREEWIELPRLGSPVDGKSCNSLLRNSYGITTQALSNMALLMLLRRMERNDLTAHGFRSTFRD
jgi:hypothetical protein